MNSKRIYQDMREHPDYPRYLAEKERQAEGTALPTDVFARYAFASDEFGQWIAVLEIDRGIAVADAFRKQGRK